MGPVLEETTLLELNKTKLKKREGKKEQTLEHITRRQLEEDKLSSNHIFYQQSKHYTDSVAI